MLLNKHSNGMFHRVHYSFYMLYITYKVITKYINDQLYMDVPKTTPEIGQVCIAQWQLFIFMSNNVDSFL